MRLIYRTAITTLIVSLSSAVFVSAMAADGAGEIVFQRACVACHASMIGAPAAPAADPAAPRALPREMLRQLSPEAVLAALTTGKMQAQGSTLTDDERRAVAQFATGKVFGAATYGSAATAKPNLCKSPATAADLAGPAWNGWSSSVLNTRFQPQQTGGLTAADLPKLKLKWAFGYTNVSSARAQPTVLGNVLFAATDAGDVHALNAKTGCTYWNYKAQGSIDIAPSAGPYVSVSGKRGHAVYFGDRNAIAYALDALTGELIWTRKVDDHRAAGITGSPTLHGGRLYVPVQGVSEESTGAANNYPCCTFRGSLSSLDANTGAVIWKTYTIEPAKPRGKAAGGAQLFGPAGAPIWSAPTVDAKRGLVYVATGNGYAEPSQPGTDAIIALDLATGSIRWMKQVAPDDNWAMGCTATNENNPSCPSVLGPDYDFSASPALVAVAGRDMLVVPQKSAVLFALDPDKRGEILWQYRFGKGSGMGGQWGGAVEGDRYVIGTADLLTPTPGGMHAVDMKSGKVAWEQPAQAKLCLKYVGQECRAGQGGALTAIPGAVLNAGLDGGLRAYSVRDGSIVWLYDTNRDFDTVNGVIARGGGMDRAGPVVAGGMLFLNSGYGGFVGHPGNVLLAFGLE